MGSGRYVGGGGKKGICCYLVARLTGTVLCIGYITVLGRVFCHILPTTAMCGQCAAIYGNVPFAAICSVLPYSARVLPYSARVRLYRVGRMR